MTEFRESIHSFVSVGSISSFEAGSAKTFLTCLTWFTSPLVFGFSWVWTSLIIFFSFEADASRPFSIVANTLPSETLSPILTFKSLISPAAGEGISTLDLSLSIVTMGSFLFIWSPGLTKISITSTSLKSPISGTEIFWAISLL